MTSSWYLRSIYFLFTPFGLYELSTFICLRTRAALGKPVNTAPRTHAHSHMHTLHMHAHTHHMHAPRVHLCICFCSTSFSLEPDIPPFFSCDLSSLFGNMVETVTSFFFGEVASRFRLRDQTAEGTCSLLCVRTWGNPCPESLGCIAALASFALLCFATLFFGMCCWRCVIIDVRRMEVHANLWYGWILFCCCKL